MESIIPAIIPNSLHDLADHLRQVRGATGRVQIDVKNGSYAPGTSWPYDGIRADFDTIMRDDDGLPYWQDFDYEIDLLIRNPLKHLEEWALAGAACCIVHIAVEDNFDRVVDFAQERRLELGCALVPREDIAVIEPYVDKLAFVQVMGNERIGYQGTALDPQAVLMIASLRARYPSLPIGVDIGVSEATLPTLVRAGATRFAAGSAVFGSSNPKKAIENLRNIVVDEGAQMTAV